MVVRLHFYWHMLSSHLNNSTVKTRKIIMLRAKLRKLRAKLGNALQIIEYLFAIIKPQLSQQFILYMVVAVHRFCKIGIAASISASIVVMTTNQPSFGLTFFESIPLVGGFSNHARSRKIMSCTIVKSAKNPIMNAMIWTNKKLIYKNSIADMQPKKKPCANLLLLQGALLNKQAIVIGKPVVRKNHITIVVMSVL